MGWRTSPISRNILLEQYNLFLLIMTGRMRARMRVPSSRSLRHWVKIWNSSQQLSHRCSAVSSSNVGRAVAAEAAAQEAAVQDGTDRLERAAMTTGAADSSTATNCVDRGHHTIVVQLALLWTILAKYGKGGDSMTVPHQTTRARYPYSERWRCSFDRETSLWHTHGHGLDDRLP